MGFVILDPAILASLLAGALAPGSVAPGLPAPARPTSACSAAPPSTAGFDCCLHIEAWDTPTTPSNHHPAQSQDGAADQQEGR
jgi:hypothetical protein